MRRRVLILGAGQLAHALKGSAWLARDAVDVMSRTHPSKERGLDLAHTEAVRHFFANSPGFDLVINTAAQTDVDACERDPESAHQVNARGVKELALGCASKGIPLIHISTNYVFSGSRKSAYKEEDAPGPCSVYGLTKLEGELQAQAHAPYVSVIRTSWIFGEGPKNFVNKMRRNLEHERSLSVVFDQIASLTYAPDLAEAIGRVAEEELLPAKSRKMPIKSMYHIVNKGVLSRYDMVLEMKRLLDSPTVVHQLSHREFTGWAAVRPTSSALDTTRFQKRFGVTLPSWKKALQRHLKEREA